ncbi:MAG: phosphatidylserine decarboxylase [Rickettsiaceae bacterium]
MKQYSDFANIIHKEGYVFIVIFIVITFLFASFSSALGWIGFLCTAWCVYFFRNPSRFVPDHDDLVVGPADGIVQQVVEIAPPLELGLGDDTMIRVSIFLNIFNVHVNRIPASGKILSLNYNPGKFFNASLDKASQYNERQSVVMETKSGHKLVFVQIAGLIARRIVCNLEEENEVKIGERYGIIRFGSRVDIYLPLKTAVFVSEGQTCIGGETIIANFASNKTQEFQYVKI